MRWQRRLRDIAMAGGLVGCAAQSVGGGTTTTTSGHGGATTSVTGVGGNPVPACNADPDPCCPCSTNGQGGYGGAACVDKPVYYNGDAGISCASELACAKAPTQACCAALGAAAQLGPAAVPCLDAGPGPADAGSD